MRGTRRRPAIRTMQTRERQREQGESDGKEDDRSDSGHRCGDDGPVGLRRCGRGEHQQLGRWWRWSRRPREDRRSPTRLEVVPTLGDCGPGLLREDFQGSRAQRGRLHHQQRRGRPERSARPGRSGDHRRREGTRPGEPRQRLRFGDYRYGPVAGRDGHRLRPVDRWRQRRLLRQWGRDGRGPPAGPGVG